MQIREGLQRFWAAKAEKHPGLPPFGRLWGLAEYQNRSLAGRLSGDDLLDLFIDATLYCLDRFDENHPPRQGVCRRSPGDRFTYYFGRKLAWGIRTALRARKRRRRDRGRFRGPRSDRYETVPQPKTKTPLLQLVHRAMDRVDAGDADLVRQRYWLGQSWKAIAQECGFTSRFQARRKLRAVEATLRDLVEGELKDALVHAQDDFEAVKAALAA